MRSVILGMGILVMPVLCQASELTVQTKRDWIVSADSPLTCKHPILPGQYKYQSTSGDVFTMVPQPYNCPKETTKIKDDKNVMGMVVCRKPAEYSEDYREITWRECWSMKQRAPFNQKSYTFKLKRKKQ